MMLTLICFIYPKSMQYIFHSIFSHAKLKIWKKSLLSAPKSGDNMPEIIVPLIAGGTYKTGTNTGWEIIHVYRGAHCPLCRQFLTELNGSLDQLTEMDVNFVAISADSMEKAQAQALSEGWKFNVGYGLTPELMRILGVYITSPLPNEAVDHEFAEPAFFIVNPERKMHIISLTTAPIIRADVKSLIVGLKFTISNGIGPRGTAD